MTAPTRWPLHPPPSIGEALSSWLTRIADAHQLRLDELLANNLGAYTFDVFDRTAGGSTSTRPASSSLRWSSAPAVTGTSCGE